MTRSRFLNAPFTALLPALLACSCSPDAPAQAEDCSQCPASSDAGVAGQRSDTASDESPEGGIGGGGAGDGGGAGLSSDAGATQGQAGDGGAGGQATNITPGLFVDPVLGKDAPSCPSSSPCRTLSHALTVAADADTIYLAPGNYSKASGETFDVPLPADVTIESRVAGQAVLLSDGKGTALSIPHGGSLRFIQVTGFELGVVAEDGQVALDGVEFSDVVYAATFRGSTTATMKGGSIKGAFDAIDVRGSARVVVSGLHITESGGSPSCDYSGNLVFADGSARVTLENVHGESLKGNIRFDDKAALTMTGTSLIGVIDPNCLPIFSTGESEQSQIDGSNFENFQNVYFSQAAVKKSKFTNARISTHGQVSIVGSTVSGPLVNNERLGTGISAGGGALTLDDVFFRGLAVGLEIGSYANAQVTVRNTTFQANDVGVAFHTSTGTGLDLGNSIEVGANVFSGNHTFALKVYGTGAVGISASGNAWEPNVQGADAAGHVAAGKMLKGPYVAVGTNFRIESAGPHVQF